MRFLLGLAFMFLVLEQSSTHGQKHPTTKQQQPLETAVCQVLENPSAYNNKLVRVRGTLDIGAEYSLLVDQGCSGGIWFALQGNSAPPQLVATVGGRGTPGGKDPDAKRTPPLPVHLVKDSNYRELIQYLETSAKGEACLDEPTTVSVPDCTTYRITATFTGRIDSVSKETHEAHAKRTSRDSPDFKGFGHMGMFDAQLVVQTVENVVAVPKN